MKNTAITYFGTTILLSGIELLYDFSRLNLFSLQVLLANMEFYFKKKLNENPVFLFASEKHNDECTTMIFLGVNGIRKVRYLNANIEKLLLSEFSWHIHVE